MTLQDPSAGEDLRAAIQRAMAQVDAAQTQQAVHEPTIKAGGIQSATVRYYVTIGVVSAYILYAFGVGVYVAVWGDGNKTDHLIDIMKTLLFPIVTLVIGFYFGSKSPE